MFVEVLESRRLLSAVYPTATEQYLLELINRARANPAAEAARFGIDLNEGLAPGTLSSSPRQPLAFNRFLIDAARRHSKDMIARDYFAHDTPAGSTPRDRMAAAGYFFDPSRSRGWGENIAYTGAWPTVPDVTISTRDLHKALFVDEGIDGRGHRLNILDENFREVGTGVATGIFTRDGGNFNAVMITQDFAFLSPGAFLTGVAYFDRVVKDNFYTPGEGLGGITITATRVSDRKTFTTTTFTSGGYSLPVDAGTYTLVASGGRLKAPITFTNVVVGDKNVKRDFVPTAIGPAPDVTPPKRNLIAPAVTRAGGKVYTLKVTYSDPRLVKASTVGERDVKITGPHGFLTVAKFAGKTSAADAKSITAIYKFVAPGRSWDASDNGVYTVSILRNQVSDVAGNFIPVTKIGTFTVKIPRTAPAKSAQPRIAAVPLLRPAVEFSSLPLARPAWMLELTPAPDLLARA